MIARRGFFGRLAGLLGVAALPIRHDVVTKPAEPKPEPIEIKKGTVTELPNDWVVTYRSTESR